MKTTAIVFSKNRPIQLFALLESMFKNSNMPPENVNVLYNRSPVYLADGTTQGIFPKGGVSSRVRL
jgi:phosphatidate phosphatase APP1